MQNSAGAAKKNHVLDSAMLITISIFPSKTLIRFITWWNPSRDAASNSLWMYKSWLSRNHLINEIHLNCRCKFNREKYDKYEFKNVILVKRKDSTSILTFVYAVLSWQFF